MPQPKKPKRNRTTKKEYADMLAGFAGMLIKQTEDKVMDRLTRMEERIKNLERRNTVSRN